MIIAVIYLLGAIHGFILAIVLAQKKVNKLPNRFLALMMMVFSVDLGMAAFQSFELLVHYPQFIGIDYPVTLLYGPLLFLYVKTLRDGQTKMERSDYLHFIPFLLLLVYMIPFYTDPAIDKLALLGNTGVLKHTYGFESINFAKVLHPLVYVGCVLYMLVSYQKKLKDSFSSIEKINLNWLQHFMTGVVLLASISGGLFLLMSMGSNVLIGLNGGIYDDITLLSTTAFVYGIGYMGLHQPEVFTEIKENKAPEITQVEDKAEEASGNPYQKSGLGREEANRYIRRLIKLMDDEKLYKSSDLNLIQLSRELEISPHNLTEIINRYIGQNFYDFVNGYRVEEVKRRLVGPESQKLTLLAIGLDAGFNSKSTFNAVFKKQTGTTPSQFRKNHL